MPAVTGGTEQESSRGAVSVLRSAGDLGRDMLAVDWSTTPLGSPDTWPQSLTFVLRTMLGSRFAMWMGWGPELSFFCNDAYRHDTLGLKYPWALGKPASVVWQEIWDDIGPRVDSVLRTGQATWDEALMLYLQRSGFREETYHTFSYSALADDRGDIVGLFCVVAEETERVVGERRIGTLNTIASSLSGAHAPRAMEQALQLALGQRTADLPFTLTYLREHDDDDAARLASATGRLPAPARVSLSDDHPWPLARAEREGTVVMQLPEPPGGNDADAPTTAVLVPLAGQGRDRAAGVFIAGLSPNRPADVGYVAFVELVAGQIASAVASVRAYDDERRRAEQLAELDRAKTAFFTNVSHEFRTPLTLMLGPLRDALADDGDAPAALQRERIALAERNGKRLLALVNMLLDFNRLEAGRLEANLEPVDLALETAELASMFRSAIEQGGVELRVDCPPAGAPVEIDRRWWEQIVTNLLSNAFKHTFRGAIEVALRLHDTEAELTVRDSGVGIPDDELPRVFERFHRVEGGEARSVEGSGIGLALVRELVESLGGRISLESRLGEGTAVHVTVPARPLRGVSATAPATARETAEARVAEARGWVSAAASASPSPLVGAGQRRSVLVVDDNSDMRAYLVRLLEERYDVRAAPNGAAALELVRADRPDLVLSDVMMPEVDGYELLRLIRSDAGLADLPVVLLSARAGPESAVEGLELGADDYLVKPFTAEDLLGRVGARLAGGAERRQRQAIAQLGRRLGQAADVDELIRAVHDCVADGFGASNAVIGLAEDGGEMLRYWHAAPPAGGLAARYHRVPVESDTPSATAAREGAVVVLESRADAAAYGRVVDDWEIANVRAQVAVPLVRATGDMAGVLAVTWDAERPLPPDEVDQLEEIASLTLEALERLRAAQVEHRILERLQERLLEVDLRAPTATVSVRYQPADSALLLGGDWYDVISFPDGRLGVSVGDVVGHGLPAATVMGQLRSALGVAATTTSEPAAAVDLVDAYARRLPTATGATLIYLVLDPAGTLTWCSAGHVPALVEDGSEPRFLGGPHRPPLGASRGDGRDADDMPLPPGSLVLVYTDGLVERRGEPLDAGLMRLQRLASVNAHLPIGQLCDAVIDGMRPEDGFADDIALVALRTPGRRPDRFVDVFHADVAQVPHARQRLREWLSQAGIADEERDDVLLAVGEAVANAIEHGSGVDARRVVSTEVSLAGGTLRAAVSDTGRWDRDSSTGPARGRGRGFQVMNALMASVDVHRGWVGTTVSLERTVGGPSAATPAR